MKVMIGRVEKIKLSRIVRGPIYQVIHIRNMNDTNGNIIEAHIIYPGIRYENLECGQVIEVTGHYSYFDCIEKQLYVVDEIKALKNNEDAI